MSGVIAGLIPGLNSILGLRDSLGVVIKETHIVTRTWSGAEPGDGTAQDVLVKMVPSPRVVEFKLERINKEGGSIQAGDIMLKMVSKQTYDSISKINDVTEDRKIEILYDVGGVLYRPIEITEKHVVYNITLRRLTDQTRY